MPNSLFDKVQVAPLLADGAMGTMLHAFKQIQAKQIRILDNQ